MRIALCPQTIDGIRLPQQAAARFETDIPHASLRRGRMALSVGGSPDSGRPQVESTLCYNDKKQGGIEAHGNKESRHFVARIRARPQ
ncbi:MAG TPA: hypothetical protein VI251_05800 [Pseudolabrys sp.]|jgi:hypothetical protein